jgi:aspartate ammonia-lyase
MAKGFRSERDPLGELAVRNRAGELLGGPRGTYPRVHPNDHVNVNMGQSTNDVFPTATRLALLLGAAPLLAAARTLVESLARKAGRE